MVTAGKHYEVYFIFGTAVGIVFNSLIFSLSLEDSSITFGLLVWGIYVILGFRRGFTGAAVAVPSLAFAASLALSWNWEISSSARSNFYTTAGQVLPTLLIAFAIEGRVLRTTGWEIKVIAIQVIIGLGIGEAAVFLGLSGSGSSGAELPVVIAALVSGFVAVAFAALIPEQPARDVFTVDPDGRGDYRTIGAAIRAATAGTTIKIRPGTYREGISLTTPRLTVKGDGERDQILIQAHRQNALFFSAEYGRVENLTIHHTGSGRTGRQFAVDVTAGFLEIRDCDVTGSTLACVAVHMGAKIQMTSCRLHHSREGSGLVVYDGGHGTVRNSDIYTNALSGIEIRDEGSAPIFTGNRVYDNNGSAFYVSNESNAKIDE
jgi:hypothetical protein